MAPLTFLHCGKPISLSWNPKAQKSFQLLKDAFSTAPILLPHPDPTLPFVVEVDTTGLGAVLSQYRGEPPRLHPCTYYSLTLTPVEQNYKIGNRELRAIKLALEEWRHWLEGAGHPFIVVTDHKNLEYLQKAKRLNPRQAHRLLFFTRFDFSITRPEERNVKANSLSRLHSPDAPTDPEPILPPAVRICPIQWDLEDQICIATHSEHPLCDKPFWACFMSPGLWTPRQPAHPLGSAGPV